MKILSLVVFLFYTAKTAAADSTEAEQLDLKDIERNDIWWMNLFSKINTILNETTKLSEGQIILNKSQDELERKLADFKNSTENHFTEFNKSQEADKQLFKQYFIHLEWTTILRRQDGSVDFYRNWTEYQKGFGNPDGEFFIGMDRLHAMTSAGAQQELIVILRDFKNEERIAKYDVFRIGNEAEKYAIKELGTYSGDAGDSLSRHKGMKFTTSDEDNDTYSGNCAKLRNGAWWFFHCYDSHLFGKYRSEENTDELGVEWYGWKTPSLKFAEMKIRPRLY